MGAAASVKRGDTFNESGQLMNIFGDDLDDSNFDDVEHKMTWIVTPELCGGDVHAHCIIFDQETFQVTCDQRQLNIQGQFTEDGHSAFCWTAHQDKLKILVQRDGSQIRATLSVNGVKVEEMKEPLRQETTMPRRSGLTNLAAHISKFIFGWNKNNKTAKSSSSKLDDDEDEGEATAAARPLGFAAELEAVNAKRLQPKVPARSSSSSSAAAMNVAASSGDSSGARNGRSGHYGSGTSMRRRQEERMERVLLQLGRIGFDTDDRTRSIVENAGGDITVAVAMIIATADGKDEKVYESVQRLAEKNESLVSMGFLEKNLNLNMLIRSGGDVSAAAAILLTATAVPSGRSQGATERAEIQPKGAPAPASGAYSTQLEALHQMGFLDDGINLSALDACKGDVDQAIAILVSEQASNHTPSTPASKSSPRIVSGSSSATAVATPIASSELAEPIDDALPSGK